MPPQTSILLPVQTAVCLERSEGALVALIAVQTLEAGLKRAPSFRLPPQTIISLPVHTAVC